MLTTIKGNDGAEYHADEIILDDGHKHISPIVDDNGRYVPSNLCICHAMNSFECVCGAWNRGIQAEFNFEDYDEEEE